MPHPILFLENLPQDATTDDIAAVFKVVCSLLFLFLSLELSDTNVNEPCIRALVAFTFLRGSCESNENFSGNEVYCTVCSLLVPFIPSTRAYALES